MQYYEDINDRLERLSIDSIMTNDIDAWDYHQEHKWIYNKLWLVEKQNIACGPVGTSPTSYPIIIKPIINLFGMSKGFIRLNNKEEYNNNLNEGSFWMPFLSGKNYTVDLVLNQGKIVAYYGMESKPGKSGTFEYHKYKPYYKLSENIIKFIESLMTSYTGVMNIEIIDNVIIEAHLRLNGDCYIYDDEFFIQVDNMIAHKEFKFDYYIRKFYLFPYFVQNFTLTDYKKKLVEDLLLKNDIKNIRWDDIESDYQRNDYRRLLMFKTYYSDKGKLLIKAFDKVLHKKYSII